MKQVYPALGLLTAAAPAFADDALLTLPLADSFANAQFAPFWTNERVSGNFSWEAVEKPENTPSPVPYDEDGGLLYYHSYMSMSGNTARLHTAPIAAASATAPVIQFYLYHNPVGNDLVKVQVSADGGEWVAASDYALTVSAPEGIEVAEPVKADVPALGTAQRYVRGCQGDCPGGSLRRLRPG